MGESRNDVPMDMDEAERYARDHLFRAEQRDKAAEEWLMARHDDDWYIGSASVVEWEEAYAAVDGQGRDD